MSKRSFFMAGMIVFGLCSSENIRAYPTTNWDRSFETGGALLGAACAVAWCELAHQYFNNQVKVAQREATKADREGSLLSSCTATFHGYVCAGLSGASSLVMAVPVGYTGWCLYNIWMKGSNNNGNN